MYLGLRILYSLRKEVCQQDEPEPYYFAKTRGDSQCDKDKYFD